MTPADRRAAWVTMLVAGTAVAVVAALLVPWDPVPGGRLEPLDPSSVFTAEQVARAEDFARWTRILSWGSLLVSLALACWLAFSARGRAFFARLPGPWWLQVVLAVAAVEVLRRLVTLPFAVLLRREQREVGLSTQSWPAFALDLLKGEVLGILVTSVVLVAALACARRWPRVWPAVAGGGLALLVLAGSFAYPVLVEPIFNDFEPLREGPLRAGIERLADQEDVTLDDVLVADASQRTTTLNAYVSGFGSTRRVVVYDTLVDGLSQDQALSVVAHELAHARRRDVVTGSVLGAAGAAFAVGLLALVLGARRRRGWPAPSDPAVVPFVLALVAIGSLAGAPLGNTVSRQIETRADVDGLRTTDDPETFIEMQRQLMLRSLADPTPPAWSHFWFGSHPRGLTRMALAERLARD